MSEQYAHPPLGVDDFTKRDLEVMSSAENYRRWILNTLIQPHLGARVLEVGSGIGNYSQGILSHPKVQSLTCVELDQLCLDECRLKLKVHGDRKDVTFIQGDYLSVDLPASEFDTVVCVNVLEHLRDDQEAATRSYASLAPGGRFVIYVPAFEGIAGAIDARLGHFRRYTKGGASTLLRSVGFEISTMRYWNAAGFLGWFVRFRVLGRRDQNPRVIVLFDRIVFPVQAWVETRIPWQPFGQSLFIVAKKPRP